MSKPTSIVLTVKAVDACGVDLYDENRRMIAEYCGYVPEIMPADSDGFHDPDHVSLHIDLETGKILNWKKPTRKALKKTFPFAY